MSEKRENRVGRRSREKIEAGEAVRRASREIVEAFEAGRIDAAGFRHPEHVRLTWAYLSCHSLLETLEMLPRAIRRFAAAHDSPGLYHETVTWAYIMVIHERLQRLRATGANPSFEELARANEDLFEWPSPILQRHYRDETIHSPRAREHFVWPDRCPPP